MEEDYQREHPEISNENLVFCLSIDLIGSTTAGLELITQKLDKFNISLVNQIKPHLEKLDLTDAVIKFTGDGWLVMTEEPKKAPGLCCLATIMANRFQEEMSEKTGIAINKIPSIRLAICLGRDISVQLPDGRKDWVGDSARRATRVSGCCYPNEILIDEPVRYSIFRDFDVKPINIKQRPIEYQPKKMEENLTLCILGKLKIEEIGDSETPEYFVYTLNVLGEKEDATTAIKKVSENLENKATKLDITGDKAYQRILRSWNRLMASISDYSIALDILKSIQNAGLAPNVITHNTLINKAPDYEIAVGWLDMMQKNDIQPDVITFNTLINKAPD